MKKSEFAQIVMALQTYYPREKLLPNDDAINLWYEALQDLDAVVLGTALKRWVSTQKWPPTIAELREQAQLVTSGDLPSWGKAWETVQDAIHIHGIYEYKAACKMFDAVTQSVVDFIGWDNICMSDNHEATRANFRMLYDQEAKRKKEERNVPPAVQAVIQNIQELLQKKAAEIEAKKGGADNG